MFAVTALEQIWNTRLLTGKKIVVVSRKYRKYIIIKKRGQENNTNNIGGIESSRKICLVSTSEIKAGKERIIMITRPMPAYGQRGLAAGL